MPTKLGDPAVLLPRRFSQQKVTVRRLRELTRGGRLRLRREGRLSISRRSGTTPEYIEACHGSGLRSCRHNVAAAERNSSGSSQAVPGGVAHRKLDAEPICHRARAALGGRQALAAQNRRRRSGTFSWRRAEEMAIHIGSDRIQKNINLLTLEGKPVPVLDIAQGIGSAGPCRFPRTGHPVLLFLWAHWCSDCKNEVAIVQKLMANTDHASGVVAPTQHYGYFGGQRPPDWRRSTSSGRREVRCGTGRA